MTSRELAYWLQGYFELTAAGGSVSLSGAQAEMIRAHCLLVLAECPNDLFAIAVGALADDAPALGKVIAAQFSTVTRPVVPPSTGGATAPHPLSEREQHQRMADMLRDLGGGTAVKYC